MKSVNTTGPRSSVNDTTTTAFFYVCTACYLVLLSNGIYLAATDLAERISGKGFQNIIYQYMFAFHLLLGLITILITVIYLYRHWHRVRNNKNTGAARKGKQLIGLLGLIYISGLLLTRGVVDLEGQTPLLRIFLYGLHIGLPVIAILIYLNHRKAGNNKRQALVKILVPMLVIFAVGPLLAHIPSLMTTGTNETTNTQTFFPSLIKTSHGAHIPAQQLSTTEYCRECHQDTHERWSHSAHRFSSFNNPFYRVAVNNLRQKLEQRDGNVEASRFCAGCHDVVPLLSGDFDRADFDVDTDASASTGITCTVCHSITQIDSPRGNSDFTITPPEHYPFAFSESESLRWINKLLIKSNPDFHKRTFLKPLHKTAEFCSGCHKVHIPPEVNHYRWLRGQNHYDAFLLSGVSGTSVSSFYYPPKAIDRCSHCHMPAIASDEFGAQTREDASEGDRLHLSDHLFPAANTALNYELENNSKQTLETFQKFMQRSARVDIIGLREDGKLNGRLISAAEGSDISLKPGATYLLEVVVRTIGVGHTFTQGTADSNQVWLHTELYADNKLIADNGSIDPVTGKLAANSHLINAYLIDKNGNKIDQRNAEDIHTTLYNNQIPPGAADAVHYRFTVPENISGNITLAATLKYRKFTTDYYRLASADSTLSNTLPITAIATHRVTISATNTSSKRLSNNEVPQWQRLNDYGIGLFRKPGKAQFRQAEEIFKQVERLGRQEGTLNLARLYYHEGRLQDATDALNRLDHSMLANPWTATWFTALINRDNGFLDDALAQFKKLINTEWPSAQEKGFDFSRNYKLLNTYAATLLTRAKLEKADSPERLAFINKARHWYKKVLTIDPENAPANFGLFQAARQTGALEQAEHYRKQHEYYKIDDSAKDLAMGLARKRDPYADLTANPVVVYELVSRKEKK